MVCTWQADSREAEWVRQMWTGEGANEKAETCMLYSGTNTVEATWGGVDAEVSAAKY